MERRSLQSFPAAKQLALKRDIGWYGSFSMGYADVGADIYIALGLVAFYAGGASPLAFAIASVTYICTGLAYSELATVYPYAGGAHVFAMKAFNDFWGFVAGWAVMLDYTVDIALFSIATSGYLSYFQPWIRTGQLMVNLGNISFSIPYLGLIAFTLVIFLLLLNLIGIRESSTFNMILVTWTLVINSFILIAGLLLAFDLGLFLSQIQVVGSSFSYETILYPLPQIGVDRQNFLYGVTIAMTSFIGIESIAQAAEETRKPYRWIPRASKLSIISVLIFALGFSTVATGMVPWTQLAESQINPMAAVSSKIPLLGEYLALFVGVTGFAICYVSTNTGIIGASRVVFSMGRFHLIPKWFHKVHGRFRTPTRTILLFGLLGAAMSLVGELKVVADLYAFGALFSYVLVNVSLIVLRNREPEVFRPWKLPWSLRLNLRGKRLIVPVISVIGTIACLTLWLFVALFHEWARVLGTLWIVIGAVGFVAFRLKKRVSVTHSGSASLIAPAGYVMNALVLVRIPEEEDIIVSSIKEALDHRFRITLLSILDPHELALSLEDLKGYEEIKDLEEQTLGDLQVIARRLRSEMYEVDARVQVGPMAKIIEQQASLPTLDAIVLIKRKTVRSDIEKERDDSIYAVASKYSGKLMVIRRSE